MNWKNLVGSVAPVLGTALGGPFGGMAGKFIADALGVDEAALEETVLSANPETMLQIKNIDNKFKLKLKELDISEEQLHHQDRASARDMGKNTTLIPQAIISTIFIIGFVVVLYAVFKGTIQLTPMQMNMANILIGILSAGIMQIMNFWFGSSSGSKEKTKKLSIK